MRAEYAPDHPHASPDSGFIPPVETRFKPGQSGNPGGWSKSFSARYAAQRELAKNPDGEGVGAGANALGLKLIADAMAGDPKGVQASSAAIDQVEGRPKEFVEHSGTTSIQASFVSPRAPESP